MSQVFIDGQNDETQLRVQGAVGQSAPLQTWEDDAGNVQAQVTDEGYLQVGTPATTDESLIEAHADSTTSSAQRGVNTLGRLLSPLSDAVSWLASELELPGSGTISGIHTALRARLTHQSIGDSSNAELRAVDVEAVNESGTSTDPLNTLDGVHTQVSNRDNGYVVNAQGLTTQIRNMSNAAIEVAKGIAVLPVDSDDSSVGYIGELVGLDIGDMQQGSNANFAIRTGIGKVQFGDLTTGTVQANTNGTLVTLKHKPNATTNPTASNDGSSGQGYAIGSIWTNQAENLVWRCINATQGSAEWVLIGGTIGARVFNANASLNEVPVSSIGGTRVNAIVKFNGVRYDHGNLFQVNADNFSGRFTASVTGLYQIEGGIVWESAVDSYLMITKGGVGRIAETKSSDTHVQVSTTAQLNAGDYVQLKAAQYTQSPSAKILASTVSGEDFKNVFAISYLGTA